MRGTLLIACLLPVLCSAQKEEPRLAAVVSVVQNHDHPAEITYRLVESGVRTFPLGEKEGHTHTITLTAEQVSVLLLGMPVTVESTMTNAHTHQVTVRKQD